MCYFGKKVDFSLSGNRVQPLKKQAVIGDGGRLVSIVNNILKD